MPWPTPCHGPMRVAQELVLRGIHHATVLILTSITR
jgi:hypothetical protein